MSKGGPSSRPRANRVAPLAMTGEVDLVQLFLQVRHGRADRLSGLVRDRLHALQTPNHTRRLSAEQAGQRRFHPMSGARPIGAVLGLGHRVQVAAAMVSSPGSDGPSGTALPPTSRSTARHLQWHTDAPDPLGSARPPGLGANAAPKGLFVVHLVPRDQLLDAVVVDQVEAKALGFVVFSLPAPSPGPAPLAAGTPPFGGLGTAGHVGRGDGQHHDRPPLAAGGRLRKCDPGCRPGPDTPAARPTIRFVAAPRESHCRSSTRRSARPTASWRAGGASPAPA